MNIHDMQIKRLHTTASKLARVCHRSTRVGFQDQRLDLHRCFLSNLFNSSRKTCQNKSCYHRIHIFLSVTNILANLANRTLAKPYWLA